jgi:hypothetical protein
MTTCVFCGKPIGDGELAAGRPPMAAHAACADAALADDAHWDRVAAASPEPDETEDAPAEVRRDRGARTGGCLTLLVVVALGLVMAALGLACVAEVEGR